MQTLIAALLFCSVPTHIAIAQRQSSPAGSANSSPASAPQKREEPNAPRRPKPPPDVTTKEAVVEALSVIQNNYATDRLAYDRLFKHSIVAMLRALDPHSDYMDPKEFAEQKAEWARSEYSGIGATIGNRRTRAEELDTYILSTFDNAPARRAGLRFGDRILAIDGQSVVGQFSNEVRDKLRGPRGTVVQVTVERSLDLSRETFAITRVPVPQPTVSDSYLLRPGVGYIDLSGGFNFTTADEFIAALEKLKSQGATSLVLDLRSNGGGIIAEAIKVAERFLQKDRQLVAQKGTGPLTGHARAYYSSNSRPETFPLVVLVGRSTASAAEILAGALQDNDRALIVGEPTFGKALVQSIIGLDYGAGLTLTTSRYYTPSGRMIQRDYSDISYYDYITRGGIDGSRNTPAPRGPASRTSSGRLVYGGAIAPDQTGVIKPRLITPLQSRLIDPVFGFVRELINGRIVVAGVDTQKIRGFPDSQHNLQPDDFTVDDQLLKAFKDYVAANENIYKVTDTQVERERESIARQIRFELATAAYGAVKARQVLIVDDPQVLKAIEVMPNARTLASGAQTQ